MTDSAQSDESPASACMRMTTAEATVAALVAHDIDTIYALPGVHNDSLFDALFRAGDRVRTIHTRHEQGAAYMALGAALATAKPQAYAVVPGPGLLNSWADSAIGHRPWARAFARDSRPARHHRPAGRLLRAYPRAKRSRGTRRPSRPGYADRPSRPRGAGMRDRRVGSQRSGSRGSATLAGIASGNGR